MASASSDVAFAVQVQWFAIRDMLVGENSVLQNIPSALQLAATCEHPDARWLSSAFAQKLVTTRNDALQVFLALGEDARALCFAWCLGDEGIRDLSGLRRSAELGYGFAQACLSRLLKKEERFQFAMLAASQKERLGHFELSQCLREGTGCAKDLKAAKEHLLRAAELQQVDAMFQLASMLESSDPKRFHWWGLAATRGSSWEFLIAFPEVVEKLNSEFAEPSDSAKVFAIGRALKGHIDIERKLIFGNDFDYDYLFGLGKQAIEFYERQLKAYRRAVDSWTILGYRFGIVKDLRIMVGRLIWDSREESKYDVK